MATQMERTWQPDEVEADLRTALDLVEQLEPPDDLRLAVFNFAVQLVTQRAMRQVGGVLLGGGPLPSQ